MGSSGWRRRALLSTRPGTTSRSLPPSTGLHDPRALALTSALTRGEAVSRRGSGGSVHVRLRRPGGALWWPHGGYWNPSRGVRTAEAGGGDLARPPARPPAPEGSDRRRLSEGGGGLR